MEQLNGSSVSSSSLPPLTPELNNLYNGMSGDNKQLFVKVFRYLWGCVVPFKAFTGRSGAVYSYWAVNDVLIKRKLYPAFFSMLVFIYQLTRGNKKYIVSDEVYNCPGLLPSVQSNTKQVYLCNLTQLGYITRSWSDPDKPYLQKSYRSRNVFIKLSPAGIKLINDIEKDIYKTLLNTSLNDLIGANKKTG